MNASTFSARVTASTLTDPYAVVASAVGTLAGPLRWGQRRSNRYAQRNRLGGKRPSLRGKMFGCDPKHKFMGFGHRVYRGVKDPRAIILQDLAVQLFETFGTILTTILRSN